MSTYDYNWTSDLRNEALNKSFNTSESMFLAIPSNTLIIIMFVSGCCGNLLALYVLFRTSKKHKWKTFNRLVGILAVIDFSGILATSPVTLVVYSNHLQWVGGQHICDYFSFFMIFAGLSTVFTVGLMSLDRFLAVCFPYFYKAHMTPKVVNILMLTLFIASILIAVMPIAKVGSNVIHSPGSWCFFDFHGQATIQRIYSSFYAALGLSVIGLTTVFNIILIVVLGKERYRKNEQQRKSSVNSISNRTRKHNDIYLMVFLFGILLIFGICWTPFMVRIIINQITIAPLCTSCDLVAVRLASFNQILDPWVYILLRKENIICFVKYIKRRQNTFVRRLSELQTYGSERLSQFRSSLTGSTQNDNINRNQSLRSEPDVIAEIPTLPEINDREIDTCNGLFDCNEEFQTLNDDADVFT